MGLHPDNNNNYSSYRAPSLYSASGAPQLTAPRQQQQLQLLSSSVSLLRIWRTTTHCTKTTTTITALIELRLFTVPTCKNCQTGAGLKICCTQLFTSSSLLALLTMIF